MNEMALNILSACKAERPGTAMTAVGDNNAADDKVGSARYLNCQVDSTVECKNDKWRDNNGLQSR